MHPTPFDKEAIMLLKQSGISDMPPIDPIAIAGRLYVPVSYEPDPERTVQYQATKPHIVLNMIGTITSQRFECAAGLGEIFFDRECKCGLSTALFKYFVIALLMPWYKVIALRIANPEVCLASTFEVAQEVYDARLQTLGYR